MLDGLALTDTVSIVVTRAVLLTTSGTVLHLPPEDLPPLPVVEEIEVEPCVLCRPKGDGQ